MAIVEYTRHPPLSPRVAVLLEAARLAKGFSIREAARHLGINHSYLWLLESCQRSPSVAIATAIAGTYNMDPQDFSALIAESVQGAGRSKSAGKRL